MKLSLDQFKNKQEIMFNATGNEASDAIISDDDTHRVTGGDRELGQPLYEQKYEGMWQQAGMLLNNLR